MIAIQTNSGTGYVTGRGEGGTLAYKYAPHIDDALLFPSVEAAVKWIERVSFYNGKEGKSFSGAPRLVRVEDAEARPRYRVTGPVS